MSKKDSGKGGWIGCLIVIAVFVLPVALPIAWALWDEGTFDPDLSNDVTAVALGPAETSRLVERLKEASERQGICYGWEVDADTGAPVELGSSLGPGVDPREDPVNCPNWIMLKADYSYIFKEWSSLSLTIEDSFPEVQFDPDVLTSQQVVNPSEPGDRAVAELADAIGSLPLLAAEADLEPVPVQQQTLSPTASSDDELASLHGAGWWSLVGLGGLLVGLGLLWVIVGAVKETRS